MADEKIDLAAMKAAAEAAEAEADAALSGDDEAYASYAQRIESANERKRDKLEGLAMAKMGDRLKSAKATANGAYVVGILNADDKTDGAGKFIVRSLTSQDWKKFQEAITRANGDGEKSDRAHRNLATACIVYPKIGADLDMDDLVDRYDRFPGLAGSICSFAGDLGAVAAANRKR